VPLPDLRHAWVSLLHLACQTFGWGIFDWEQFLDHNRPCHVQQCHIFVRYHSLINHCGRLAIESKPDKALAFAQNLTKDGIQQISNAMKKLSII
jgi:hypothetical protein